MLKKDSMTEKWTKSTILRINHWNSMEIRKEQQRLSCSMPEEKPWQRLMLKNLQTSQREFMDMNFLIILELISKNTGNWTKNMLKNLKILAIDFFGKTEKLGQRMTKCFSVTYKLMKILLIHLEVSIINLKKKTRSVKKQWQNNTLILIVTTQGWKQPMLKKDGRKESMHQEGRRDLLTLFHLLMIIWLMFNHFTALSPIAKIM